MSEQQQEKRLKRGIKEMGLDELLGDIQTSEEESISGKKKDASFLMLPLNNIQANAKQPRKSFNDEKLNELSESIKAQGVIQPIVVKPLSLGGYQIIAGERRFRASQKAGLKEIPAIIREASEEATLAMALIENIQRDDLNPIEEAEAIQKLINDFFVTHQKAAEMLGKSRASITNAIRLLSLEEQVKQWLKEGLISTGHAKLLVTLSATIQIQVAITIIEKSLSVRETEQLIQSMENSTQSNKESKKAQPDPDVFKLENRLSQQLSAPVRIQHSADGKGKLTIQYHSLDELEGILSHIS